MKIKLLGIFLLLTLTFSSCSFKNTINNSYSGTIESMQTDIHSEINGKVFKINFQEGDQVKIGDVVAELDTSIALLQVQLAQATKNQANARYIEVAKGSRPEAIRQATANYDLATAKLRDIQNGSSSHQLQQAESQVAQTRSNVNSFTDNYNYRNTNYVNIKKLYQLGTASKQQLDDAKAILDQASGQLEAAQKQLDIQQSQFDLLRSGSTQEVINQAQSQVDAAKAQLDLTKNGNARETISQFQAQYEQANTQLEIAKANFNKTKIVSTVNGVVSTKNINIGEMAFSGTNIVTITDPKDLWVKVYIPQKRVNQVSLNQKVTLISSAISNTKISGEIIYISPKAEFTPKNTETKNDKENTVFEVKIIILNNIDKLKPGMVVDMIL